MLSATTENAARLLTSQTTERRPLQRTGLPNLLIIQSKCFFLFIGREATMWPANNCSQIIVCSCAMLSNCVWLQIAFCSCVLKWSKLHFSPSCDCPHMKVAEHFPWIFIRKQTQWSNDKTIIELSDCKIILQINYSLKPNNWSAHHFTNHNILLNLVQYC